MCRLFALSGGPRRVHATFWLLDAPDSLVHQSHLNPDGTGLGTFDEHGAPHVVKSPVSAYEDAAFAREARDECSRTFLAHIRHASTGGLSPENTHPFALDGRLFAHNGVVEGLPAIEERLGAAGMELVRGQTDSERVFALVTREIDAAGGDVAAGVARAVRWLAGAVPLYSLNLILTTAEEIWALRYPEGNELWLLDRERGGRGFEGAGAPGTVRVHSPDMADRPAVVVASEPLDDDPGWRLLDVGELVHIGADLTVTRELLLPDPPAHPLTLADLAPAAASSQTATP